VFRVEHGEAAIASEVGRAVQASGLPLDRFPLAVARIDDVVVALAPLLCSGKRHEIAARPIHCRHPDADIEDFLLVESMRWGCRKGFHWFDLGLASEGDEAARRRFDRYLPASRPRLMAVGPGGDPTSLASIISSRSTGSAGPA
ncbi:MAG: hypothetical protein HQL39_05375, partial [Alphaproteobacteria bacterium]|nr:hypothetical protein [Alphaproteobacteria bacterium]